MRNLKNLDSFSLGQYHLSPIAIIALLVVIFGNLSKKFEVFDPGLEISLGLQKGWK